MTNYTSQYKCVCVCVYTLNIYTSGRCTRILDHKEREHINSDLKKY